MQSCSVPKSTSNAMCIVSDSEADNANTIDDDDRDGQIPDSGKIESWEWFEGTWATKKLLNMLVRVRDIVILERIFENLSWLTEML